MCRFLSYCIPVSPTHLVYPKQEHHMHCIPVSPTHLVYPKQEHHVHCFKKQIDIRPLYPTKHAATGSRLENCTFPVLCLDFVPMLWRKPGQRPGNEATTCPQLPVLPGNAAKGRTITQPQLK